VRHSILIVRDGEESLPHSAAVIAAGHGTTGDLLA
jgi:hypothetical protein